jgi:hypothetical protein
MGLSFRDRIVARLREDLAGPSSENEVFSDRPTQRYSTGILYPSDSEVAPEEDDDGALTVNEIDDSASNPDTTGVSLLFAWKPSSAGFSFAVKRAGGLTEPVMNLEIRCATYSHFAIDEAGQEREGEPIDRAHERWRRVPIFIRLSIDLQPGEKKLDLKEYGARALELYVLVAPHGDLVTATVALCNRRCRGDSRTYDEEQHFFQVELAITGIANGSFAPRPSRRAETDDDSRAARLIYRDVKEYAVGHTCSARVTLDPNGTVIRLTTEWLPAIEVPAISDRGDATFDQLRTNERLRPLDAGWLVTAPSGLLAEGLQQLVDAYRTWISRENQRIEQLPGDLRAQAQKHIERCTHGADRMNQGIILLRDDVAVRSAFRLAQDAMRMQFGWARNGEALVWYPFQLAFQLLVLTSLAIPSHPDREIMDLLWFPTGGGKTEAYLALTAFVIFLRRLKASAENEGAGVAVLMRYTLRLLTIQQFQRAAAMICACELLRRRAVDGTNKTPQLGKAPIGIGLWVGATATPRTLRDALNHRPGDPSTPEQLTVCPSCGAELDWKLTPRESVVQCPSAAAKCEYATSGSRIPIWTIDEEIYRNAPALLIGTVDKFAQIVRKIESQVLFGRGMPSAPPDLIIQDELHLISGPLGSIAGLYEVAIDELCRRGDVRPKIIGSTATIRRASEQTRALFDRETYQFPSPGLDAKNSGFAVVDSARPGRLYLGISTAGKSATYMLQALSASLLQAAADPSQSEDERDFYWTLVVYFNSLRELGRALALMQDDVPVSIRQLAARRSEPQRKIEPPAELTSRVRSYEIRDMLERLTRRVDEPGAVDLLLASNMISVGMDIPRLGMMVVDAQPKTLSEYIQATSRVGRSQVPGLIITMYNSTRARDQSHYETFETWHRCLYRDVEATSVTPFASRAQDKALHAVLVALVRHMVPDMTRSPVLNAVRRVGAERAAAVIEARAARVDPSERAMVAQRLLRLLDEWESRPDLQTYWDDYGRRASLLMSAEQFAATAGVDGDLDPEGARRALWPTPNSMREVEAGAPFILRNVLKSEGS